MRIPIACTLEAADAETQLAQWHAVARAAGVTVQRRSPAELAIRIPGRPPAGPLVELAQREKACCPFFDFSLRIEAEALTLVVTAPPEATVLLDTLVGVTSPGG